MYSTLTFQTSGMNVSVPTLPIQNLPLIPETDAVHRSQGYAIILIAVFLSTLDTLAAIRRFVAFLKSPDKSFTNFWRIVVKKEEVTPVSSFEYASLVENPDECDSHKSGRESMELQNTRLSGEDPQRVKHQRPSSVASEHTVFGALSPTNHSEETLRDSSWPQSRSKHLGVLSRIGRWVFAVTERSLVIAGFAQLLTGIVTYTGTFRVYYCIHACVTKYSKLQVDAGTTT